MGIFSNLGKTQAARPKGQFFTAGKYEATVVSARHVKSKVGSDEFFVVDFDLEGSTNPEMPAGTPATWMTKLTGRYPEMALADIKAFLVAATGAGEEEIDEDTITEALDGDGTALAGQKVKILVEDIKTRAGLSFSKHNFFPRE